jgi:hypothetical protein
MQKFDVTQADLGVSDFDQSLGAMWSDHCINPFTGAALVDGEVILFDDDGEYRGKATLELLAGMGEDC